MATSLLTCRFNLGLILQSYFLFERIPNRALFTIDVIHVLATLDYGRAYRSLFALGEFDAEFEVRFRTRQTERCTILVLMQITPPSASAISPPYCRNAARR